MNSTPNPLRALVAAVALLGSLGAYAQGSEQGHQDAASGGLTRTEAKAELDTAIANGDIVVGNENQTLAQLDPSRYPHPAPAVGKTRAQVRAELAQAIHDGDIMVGDNGRTLADLDPTRYPHPSPASGLTRRQVRAELARAIREGDIEADDEGRTLAQINPDRYEAVRAQDDRTAVASGANAAVSSQSASM